jgi:hypothetical protein
VRAPWTPSGVTDSFNETVPAAEVLNLYTCSSLLAAMMPVTNVVGDASVGAANAVAASALLLDAPPPCQAGAASLLEMTLTSSCVGLLA